MQRKALDAEGDAKLRRSYHAAMKPFLRESPKTILDLGCATGLSTLALYEVRLRVGSLTGRLKADCFAPPLTFRLHGDRIILDDMFAQTASMA